MLRWTDLPEGAYAPAMPGTLGMNGAPVDVLVCRWNSPEALEAVPGTIMPTTWRP